MSPLLRIPIILLVGSVFAILGGLLMKRLDARGVARKWQILAFVLLMGTVSAMLKFFLHR
jgi:hypothetical protein